MRLALILAVVVVGLIAVVAGTRVYGASRWHGETVALRAKLEAGREAVLPAVVDFMELEGLPAPVQRYFRAVLKPGAPMLAGAHLQQTGTMNMSEDGEQWKTFKADQLVVMRRPGFDWDARILMFPGVAAAVHDSFASGEGALHASILGAFTVAEIRGGHDLAKGELMRWLAEAAWYPTALLPSQGAKWEAVDEHSAFVSLTEASVTVKLLCRFNEHDLIDSFRAESRTRTSGGKSTSAPWEGRFWNYAERDGMVVPLEGEVAWMLPSGRKPYWRGLVTAIEYTTAATRK